MEFISRDTNTIAGMRKPEPSGEDERFMLRALELAGRGARTASPNPMVGAVVVSRGEVAGEGFHERAGGPHAEVNALKEAAERAKGATMYVTLEPCAHYGRTPPCCELLSAAGVARVVYAAPDPNPLVAGKGAGHLQGCGVAVEQGPYSEVAERQNEAFMKWITTKRPFVTLKMAVSADGKVATATGDSRWISSEESRRDVHEMRAASDAVMVGVGTVLADDPELTARGVGAERQPLRVVLDSTARTPTTAKIVDDTAPTMLVVAELASAERLHALQAAGVEVLRAGMGRRTDAAEALEALGGRQVTSVLVEGGPTVAAGLIAGGLVDRMVLYLAPKVIGGRGAPGPVGGDGASEVSQAAPFAIDTVYEMGPDIKMVLYPG